MSAINKIKGISNISVHFSRTIDLGGRSSEMYSLTISVPVQDLQVEELEEVYTYLQENSRKVVMKKVKADQERRIQKQGI